MPLFPFLGAGSCSTGSSFKLILPSQSVLSLFAIHLLLLHALPALLALLARRALLARLALRAPALASSGVSELLALQEPHWDVPTPPSELKPCWKAATPPLQHFDGHSQARVLVHRLPSLSSGSSGLEGGASFS